MQRPQSFIPEPTPEQSHACRPYEKCYYVGLEDLPPALQEVVKRNRFNHASFSSFRGGLMRILAARYHSGDREWKSPVDRKANRHWSRVRGLAVRVHVSGRRATKPQGPFQLWFDTRHVELDVMRPSYVQMEEELTKMKWAMVQLEPQVLKGWFSGEPSNYLELLPPELQHELWQYRRDKVPIAGPLWSHGVRTGLNDSIYWADLYTHLQWYFTPWDAQEDTDSSTPKVLPSQGVVQVTEWVPEEDTYVTHFNVNV